MNRRQFLAISGIGTLCGLDIVAPPEQIFRSINYPAEDSSINGAVLVGLWYLTIHPEEADSNFLLARLPGSSSDADHLDGVVWNNAHNARIKRASKSDYARNDVVFVGGWQLARTEARICALIALGKRPLCSET